MKKLEIHLRIILFSLLISNTLFAQYAPQVGLNGCDAIPMSSVNIVDWAATCNTQRGWMNISDTTLGKVSYGDDTCAIGGNALNGIVSLGDGGSATLTFHSAIKNAPGPDFAVFENAFQLTDSLAFSELAFVEVSSDGNHFVRFPAYSFTDTVSQMDGFTGINAARIYNLAGKYISGYGTPFDLEELKDSANIDINTISHVRIVDVVGALTSNISTYDHLNHKINDPYPTPFASGGFDLDAVAVLHNQSTSYNNILSENLFSIYPIPFFNTLNINTQEKLEVSIYNMVGQKVLYLQNGQTINTSTLPDGVYTIQIRCKEKWVTTKIVKSHQ